ncbi:MAG TPA: CDP-alcohol phosphatidyltransferase family protein [Polyangia bacterium]|nr:CDP-alcohol phosphatidyltransferase family protein [Polyangia bacterium]
MMIEGAGELDRVARVTSPTLSRAVTPVVQERVPVILRATRLEARGARMRVGGLRVVDRAIRQLGRLRDVNVVIATDGSIPLPRRLPPNMDRRELDGDAEGAIERLRAQLGPQVLVASADGVWLQPARFDRATRIVDAASRRLAERDVYREAQKATAGLVDRAINQRVSAWLTRMLFARLPIAPALITLAAGFIGLYGALMIAPGGHANVLNGFLVLEGSLLLDGCAGELARVRLHQTALGAWLDTVVGDFVNIVMVLAVGMALWRHGGTYLDMKMAAASAGLTLFYAVVSYRELIRQRQGDVLKLRWWFAYGQSLRAMGGAGASHIKAITLLGRRDVVVALGIGLAVADQLPVVALYMLIIALVRAAAALGQILTPEWRLRPPA